MNSLYRKNSVFSSSFFCHNFESKGIIEKNESLKVFVIHE